MVKDYLDWSDDKIKNFRQTLLTWYDQNGRDLPWRRTQAPYAIWVSEIMLQQTQVATVIPYYERFMKDLPTIKDLAQTSQDHLHQLWQGLGYYSRVRNMQVAAQQIMADFDGKMPANMKDLLSLKGIGPYTAAAIGSIAFGLVEPAIDGNLMRVTARLFEIEEDIRPAKNRKIFETILSRLIDPDRPGDFNQALMDMGAMVMSPQNHRPDPHPLKDFDLSYQNHTSHRYPYKSKVVKNIKQHWLAYYLVNDEGQVLVRKHRAGELLQGLWHFPLVKVTGKDYPSVSQVQAVFWDRYLAKDRVAEDDRYQHSWQPNRMQLSQEVKHVFSHRTWLVKVATFDVGVKELDLLQTLEELDEFTFVNPSELSDLAISSLQEKLLEVVESEK